MNISRLFPVFLFLVIIFFSNCDTADPPIPDNRKLTLTFEDASCTEVWFTLETENLQLPTDITILLNDSVPQYSRLNTQDSLLYIDSLLPNQTYTIQSIIHSTNQSQLSSNKVTFTTMDTTSHNFTFETFTFGEHSSSVLYDVAIIDENNIWVVGEIYMNDSLGQHDLNSYNAVQWDGTKWELKRIRYYGDCSAVVYPPLKAIWAFSENKMVVTNGGSIGWFNGDSVELDCRINPLLTGSINKLWGTSSKDLYVVGNNGNLVHYNGSNWQRISSGTDLHIYDIWGDYNYETDKNEILAIASNLFLNKGNKVLQINNTFVNTINNEGLPWSLHTIWFIPGKKYYIGGDGLFYTKNLSEKWIQNNNMPPYYEDGIRGNGINDIIVVGAFGLLIHFNGFSWKNFQDVVNISGSYGRVNIKGDLVVCTGGLNNGKAIVTIGRR